MRTSHLAAAAALAAAFAAPAFAYDGIVAFGDSLSDPGNLAAFGAAPPPPYWQGHFSNGQTAVEDMAQNMHLGLQDYAYGGAETGTGNLHAPLNGTGVASQVGMYAAAHAGQADAHSLYFVWAGPNDFFALPAPQTVGVAATNLLGDVQSLYNLGARDFFVPLMPDLGATPSAGANAAALHGLSMAYDAAVAAEMLAFAQSHAGVQMTIFDTPGFFTTESALLAGQGVNVTQSCFTGVSVCANPDQYLFWDSVHPTAMGHSLLGQAFTAAAVPEPATIALLLGGLMVVGGATRRQRRG